MAWDELSRDRERAKRENEKGGSPKFHLSRSPEWPSYSWVLDPRRLDATLQNATCLLTDTYRFWYSQTGVPMMVGVDFPAKSWIIPCNLMHDFSSSSMHVKCGCSRCLPACRQTRA